MEKILAAAPLVIWAYLVLLIVNKKNLRVTLTQFLNIVFVQTALSAMVALVSFYRYNERVTAIKLIGLAFLIGAVLNLTPLVLIKMGLNGYTNICGIAFAISSFSFITLLYREQFQKAGILWSLLIGGFIVLAVTNF
jgi:hypothetical protein